MLKRSLGSFIAILLLSSCGSSGIGQKLNGDGNILLTDVATDTPVHSTQQSPLHVTNTFSLAAYEGDYGNGSFNATIVNYNNSCFTVTPVTTLSYPAFKFQTNPTTTNNPCQQGTLTQAMVTDSKGHTTSVWFYLDNTVVLAGG